MKIRLAKALNLALFIAFLATSILPAMVQPVRAVDTKSDLFYTSSGDGYLEYADPDDWQWCHDNLTANEVNDYSDSSYVQSAWAGGFEFTIKRALLYFGTSDIENTSTIISVTLHIYVSSVLKGDINDAWDWLYVQTNGTNYDLPHTPMWDTDYNFNHWQGNYGQYAFSAWSSECWVEIPLNPSCINQSSWTKLVLRSRQDINNQVCPNGGGDHNQQLTLRTYENITCQPYLSIAWTTGEAEDEVLTGIQEGMVLSTQLVGYCIGIGFAIFGISFGAVLVKNRGSHSVFSGVDMNIVILPVILLVAIVVVFVVAGLLSNIGLT